MTNQSRPVRRGPALIALLAILSLSYLGAGMALSAQTSGFNASEGSHIGGSTNFDTMWADSTRHRWMMTNYGSSDIAVSSWVCGASPGCIPFSGATASYTIYPETQLTFPLSTVGPGLPLISGTWNGTTSGVPQWGGGAGLNANQTFTLDLQTGLPPCCALALASEVPNDTTTGMGTVANKLARISTAGATKTLASDPSSNQTYVVATGAGTSANAQLAVAGQVSCIMDGPASGTEGQYVVASNNTDGDCSATATPAIGAWIVGQMISNSTASNTPALILARPGYRALSSSILGSVTTGSLVAATSLSTTNATYELATVSGSPSSGLAQWDGNGNIKDSGLVEANVLTLASPATGAVLTGITGSQAVNAIAPGTIGYPLASAGSGVQPTYQRQLITAFPSTDTITTAGTFVATLSIPGGVLAAGSVIEIRAHGVYTTPSSGNAVFALQINAGGTPGICPASSNNIPLSSSSVITNGYWDTTCTIQMTSAANSAITWGQYDAALAGGSSPQFRMFNNATSTGVVTYTTGSAQTVSLQETATLISGQSFTLQALYAKVIY